MVKFILPALALVFASPALAQSFPKPSDVPDYEDTAATYAAGTTQNVLGDNSNIRGGTPPAASEELADIPTPSRTSFLYTGAGDFCEVKADGTGACSEAKVRLNIGGQNAHMLFDDPIRNFQQPGQSHCHIFFGNRQANARSTYASIRNRSGSDSIGGDLNATAYWMPCLVKTNPFGNGKNYAVRPDYVTVYYNTDYRNFSYLTFLLRGLRYVFGVNMDDPDNTGHVAEVAAANAQTGTAGRYSGGTRNGFIGWHCILSDGTHPVGHSSPKPALNDGVGDGDPWDGTCVSGSQVYAEAEAPRCWDGRNLWSPGGYDHFRYAINDSQSSRLFGEVCPNGWYEVPVLQLKAFFSHSGPSDYTTWRLSSDDHMQTKLTQLGTPRTVKNGESFHTDWFGGWDGTTFTSWQQACNGVGQAVAHECNNGKISSSEYLIGNGFNSATEYGTASASVMFELPASVSGHSGGTLHVHDR